MIFLNGIKVNKTLCELTLNQCDMPDSFLVDLFKPLSGNTALARLDVAGNKFGVEACSLALASYLPRISLRELRIEIWNYSSDVHIRHEWVDAFLEGLE